MVSPDYIRAATLAIRTPEGSVEVNRYKGVIPTVEKCVAEMGTDTMCAAIKMQLVAINIAANAARPMSEAVIDTVAPVVLDYILSLEVSINLADFRIVFDRAMRELQARGIVAARARGVKFGRKRKVRPDGFEAVRDEWAGGHISAREAGRKLNIAGRKVCEVVALTGQQMLLRAEVGEGLYKETTFKRR